MDDLEFSDESLSDVDDQLDTVESFSEDKEKIAGDENNVDLVEVEQKKESKIMRIKSPAVLIDLFENIVDPLHQDISAMFADGVPFFVDADSILIMIMSDKEWLSTLNGSSLHLIYLIESYLNIFVERGGEFHIIFFDAWKNIWKNNSQILTYRKIMMEHFKNNTNYHVHLLNNCLEEKFSSLVSTYRPEFILVNFDVDVHCFKFGKELSYHDIYHARYMIVQHIFSFLYLDLPCVDTNDIKTEIFIVKAFYTVGSISIMRLVKDMYKIFEEFFNKPLPEVNYIETTNLNTFEINDARKLTILLASKRFTDLNPNCTDFLKIILLNYAIIDSLNIENRSCPLIKDLNLKENLLSLTNSWFSCLHEALSSLANCDDFKIDFNFVSDLWQGLLFVHICKFLQTPIANSNELGVTISKKYEFFINKLEILGINLQPYPISSAFLNLEFEGEVERFEANLGETRLLRIQNPLVLEFCKSVLHNIRWQDPPEHLQYHTEYREERHYHSMNLITDEHDRIKNTIAPMPTDPYEKKRYQRQISLHAKYMTIYGSSIEGRQLTNESVIRTNPKDDNKKEKKPPKISKKAQEIIDRNNKKKLDEKEETERKLLKHFEEDYKKSTKNYPSLLSKIDVLANKINVPKVKIEVFIWKIKLLLKVFKDLTPNSNKFLTVKKDIFLNVRTILSLQSKDVQFTAKQKDVVRLALEVIDCQEIAKRNMLMSEKDVQTNDTNWIQFQLKHLGPDLQRETDGKPDTRVRGFIPDQWQRELFDIVDRRQSALIVAPTSSGKTYASYYCMESVLKEGSEGIVVYVSPTKALVNQVAATVYARFKNTKMPDGKSVYGIFTRDFRTYATNCQILVTVPQCLELLLLSPRQCNWVKRLRYVIFDEIHCIAGSIGGISWERCLSLIKCPFLALSATIRHPEELHSWLQQLEDFKQEQDVYLNEQRPAGSYKVELVIHTERHSDLVKYDYNDKNFVHMHPYANLENAVMKLHNGIPKHIFLSPVETLRLYEVMLEVNPEDIENSNLQLDKFFSKNSKNGYITRNAVRSFEKLLADLLSKWHTEKKTNFTETIKKLKSEQASNILEQNDIKQIIENIVDLVNTLKKQNMLPAIIFSYNRHLVQKMTQILTKHLMQGDTVIDRRTKKRNEKEEKARKEIEQKERDSEKSDVLNDKKKNRRVTAFKPHELHIIDENANSLRDRAAVDQKVVTFVEDRLYRSGLKPNKAFVQALRHGVCMHHAGLNNKLRGAVEMLFRMKLLNVVFATGTLALGIHMPCKTAVIAGNSPYLNSLEYHQMSGRAGRRGYDTAGNVVFFGLNKRKQHTLLTAHLPSLLGTFPLSVTAVLRLMLLVADATDKGKKTEKCTNMTVSRILTLLENCLVYRQKPRLKDQIRHFFSFSLQFLIMQEYINGDGSPLKWSGIATHLHYHEPGNLAFIYLLKNGVIRKLCVEGGEDDDIQHKLVVLLCYLFTNVPIKNYVNEIEFDNSIVVLEPLSDLFQEALTNYNKEVKFVFNQYFTNIATYCVDKENTLPLSNVSITAERYIEESEESPETLHRKILNTFTPSIICSPFASLAGHNDRSILSSEQKILNSIKKNVCHDVNIIPTIDINAELNAYALDFYRHGIVKAIINDNGLKAGEEFTKLKDFMLIIRTIKISLEEMGAIEGEKDPVFRHFTMLDNKYSYLFYKGFPSYRDN